MEITEETHFKRQRSSRRIRYEAQAQVFENKSGSLESIRQSLGLRPSQICEILRVHPSAWIRWTRQGKAPPHVYQMLEWYMELLQWRGQHLPQASQNVTPVMAHQDPQNRVPAEKEKASETVSDPGVGRPISWTLRAASNPIAIIVGISALQTVLWCVVVFVLLKRV